MKFLILILGFYSLAHAEPISLTHLEIQIDVKKEGASLNLGETGTLNLIQQFSNKTEKNGTVMSADLRCSMPLSVKAVGAKNANITLDEKASEVAKSDILGKESTQQEFNFKSSFLKVKKDTAEPLTQGKLSDFEGVYNPVSGLKAKLPNNTKAFSNSKGTTFVIPLDNLPGELTGIEIKLEKSSKNKLCMDIKSKGFRVTESKK